MTINRYSFNGGEIAPELQWRCDLKRYYNSCKTLENFMVTSHGAVRRRPGVEIVAIQSGITRLLPFVYSDTAQYLIGLANTAIYVYSLGGSVLETLAAPFTANECAEVQAVQSNDVLYLAHKNHPVQRLERHGQTDWRLVTATITGGPWLPDNQDESLLLTPELPAWSSSTTYAAGQSVQLSGASSAISSLAFSYFKTDGYWYYYHCVFTLSEAITFPAGLNRIKITGTKNGYYDGEYWVMIDTAGAASTVRVNCGAYARANTFVNYYTDAVSGGTTPTLKLLDAAGDERYYHALQASTNKDPATQTAYWQPRTGFQGEFTLRASWDFFEEDMVGGKLLLRMPQPAWYVGGTFTATGAASSAVPASGAVKLTTAGGRWGGTIALQESLDNGYTWDTIGVISSHEADYNGEIERELSPGMVLVRAYMESYVAPATNPTGCMYRLDRVSVDAPAVVEITAYTDARTVTAETVDGSFLYSAAATADWAEGAFSPKNGYPRAICIFEERLILAGNARQPSTIWGSAVNDWEDFFPATLATSPITFSLASGSLEMVQWLMPKQELLIGTDSGIWTMGSRDRESVLSGENVTVRKHANNGCAAIQAVEADAMVVFVHADQRRVMGVQYNYEADGYVATDLTVLASHITLAEHWPAYVNTPLSNGIISLAWQAAPEPIVWALRRDNTLLSFTFSKEQEVMGWAEQRLCNSAVADFRVYCFCVIPSSDSDILYLKYETFYLAKFNAAIPPLDGTSRLVFSVDPELDPYVQAAPVFSIGTVYDQSGAVTSDLKYIAPSRYVWFANFDPTAVYTVTNSGWVEGTTYVWAGHILAIATTVSPVIKKNGVTLVKDTDYYVVTASTGVCWVKINGTSANVNVYDSGVLVPDTQVIRGSGSNLYILVLRAAAGITVGTDDVLGVDYEIYGNLRIAVVRLVSAEAADFTYYVGYPFVSLLEPTDILAAVDAGGPGQVSRTTALDVYLVASRGGEVSLNGGTTWQALAPTAADTTGRVTVRLPAKYTKDPEIQIRSTGAYPLTVACLGLDSRRY